MAAIKRKILVCGSTGFLGRNIAESLAHEDDFEVYGTYHNSPPLANPRITPVGCDLTEKTDVNKVVPGMDIVIQAAAATSGAKDTFTKPYYHVTDNAVMNALLFRASYDHKISHLVFLSCTTMYQSSDKPIKETDFDAGREIYPNYFGGAWTKVYNEKMCEFYSRVGAAKHTIIRHSNIYGPYDKYDLERSHVFGATITKVMNAAEGGEIVIWGAGEEQRDLLYVSDLVDFVKLALEKQESKCEVFNVGCGSSISVKDLVAKIIRCSGKDVTSRYDLSKPSIKTRICLDIDKARRVIGWEPKISLEEGIAKTIQWYHNNKDALRG